MKIYSVLGLLSLFFLSKCSEIEPNGQIELDLPNEPEAAPIVDVQPEKPIVIDARKGGNVKAKAGKKEEKDKKKDKKKEIEEEDEDTE